MSKWNLTLRERTPDVSISASSASYRLCQLSVFAGADVLLVSALVELSAFVSVLVAAGAAPVLSSFFPAGMPVEDLPLLSVT